MARHVALCAGRCKARKTTPPSLRTYVNSLARVFNSTESPNKFVPSCKTRFPKFFDVSKTVVTRYLANKSVQPNNEEEIQQDSELEDLWNNTDFGVPLEAQRFNILVIAMRTGYWAETLARLQVKSFVLGTLTEDDTDGNVPSTWVVWGFPSAPSTVLGCVKDASTSCSQPAGNFA